MGSATVLKLKIPVGKWLISAYKHDETSFVKGSATLMQSATHSPLYVTKELFETRYQGAEMIFLAGSVVRGEATAHSDLDLVVLFPKVDAAYRESFFHKGWPVEAFIHDLETLQYFFDHVDRQMGRATLSEMVAEGHEIPGPTERSMKLKTIAQQVLSRGPSPLAEEEVQDRRYHISELLDDLRAPRSHQELIAAGTAVYTELADFYFRSRGHWTAWGKSILKRMKKTDPALARRFSEAFDDLFQAGQAQKVIQIGEEILQPQGGLLFEGYRRAVPASWKSK